MAARSEDGDRKPIVTYHGDQELFSSIRAEVFNTLPRDPVEWRRSYGRGPKLIFMDVTFVPFTPDQLAKENERTLFRKPCFHIYFTDCADADAYKLVVKDDITAWQQSLKERNVSEWLIVLVETANLKRGNKSKLLPRTSVLDKIRSDFCSKQERRVIVLNEPNNPVPTNRSLESWQLFIQRLRELLLAAYSRVLLRFEEIVRAERERRNDRGWDFCKYFLLQEELAFTFQLFHFEEDALVQYDELDALFSQFIINTHAGDNPAWLSSFVAPCTCWDGLNLLPSVIDGKRSLLETGNVALLELRNYLFARQCVLLFTMQRPWEVAHRAQSYLHNCVQELKMLEVSMPTGSMACWVFLSCLEVLQSCEKYTDSSNVENYSHFTASLWVYAQTKLRELGELCGLMPDSTSNSDQLHLVVNLLSGMGQTQEASVIENSPNQKLREALSSSDSFQKHYLELSELAMGTFKHIKRMRSARLIGKDLATFYMKKGEWTKAETFLIDAVRIYEKEGWHLPVTNTRRQIATCQKELGNKHKYLKTCCLLAGDCALAMQERLEFLQEMLKIAKELAEERGEPDDEEQSLKVALVPLYSVARLTSIDLKPEDGKLGKNEGGEIFLRIHSNLPETVAVDKITLAVNHETQDAEDQSNQLPLPKSQSQSSFKSLSPTVDQWGTVTDGYLRSIFLGNQQTMIPELMQDIRYQTKDGKRNLDCAIIYCKNASSVLRREDSSSSLGKSFEVLQKEDCSHPLHLEHVEIKPGDNTLSFAFKASDNGLYSCKQLMMQLGGVELLLPSIQPTIGMEVSSPDPQLTVTPKNGSVLLAGIPQEIYLTIFAGYYTVTSQDTLSIQTLGRLRALPADEADGYGVRTEESGATVSLPDIPAFQTREFSVMVMTLLVDSGAEPGEEEEEELTEQKMTIWCPWSETVIATLTFQQPFHIKHQLHTAGKRKLVQLSVDNICSMQFMLTSPELTSDGPVQLQSVNGKNATATLCAGQTMSYVWFLSDSQQQTDEAEFRFTLTYTALGEGDTVPNGEGNTVTNGQGEPQQLSHSFNLKDYKTKYMVSSTIAPPSSDEFCRAGTLCSLQLHIQSALDDHQPITDQNSPSLMYQVLADKHMWAVCGRSTGVVAMPTSQEGVDVSLEVMPLLAGFLPVPKVKLTNYITGTQELSGTQPVTQVVLNQPSEGSIIPDGTTASSELDGPAASSMNGLTEPVSHIPAATEKTSPASLVPFAAGQVYYRSLATQVRVLPESDITVLDVAVQ
ncbi:trafficking protein particle complex subunit 10-like isoform X2 [Patiria miniata]|uniref:Trafficking protein particle complex subunit 10 n=1 Tax=Patiria miniata TaxID=46514 RepID=A0A914A5K3_PATMI|nr:trafficking protein particle complex subunit 10-like isoform X2 [Patiria miniata]